MAYPASLIAQIFVNKGIEEGNPVTQMKLQKMVYFAHGLYLAAYNKQPLIKETFQAWKFGPVVPDIYHTYKFYGSTPINDTKWILRSDVNPDDTPIDENARKIIDYTWNTLKGINAVKLSNWTHQEGSPWAQHYVPGVNETFIPNDEIGTYFERFIAN